MNPVTFNDKMRELLMANNKSAAKMEELFPDWETSPLFLYDEPSNEAETTAIVHAYTDDVFEVLPFPVFRLDITVGETAHSEYGKYKAKAVVAAFPDGPCVFVRVDELLHSAATYPLRHARILARSEALPIYMLIHSVKQQAPGSTDFYCSPNCLFGVGGRWLSLPEHEPEPAKWMLSYMNGFLKSLAAFNLSAMSPNNHIVQVRPAVNGAPRSVQWLQARTHYTLITHGHPANDSTVKHGSQVEANPSRELNRMAHNRRAHQRTLRHERFRYARGKTIKVRATWVGPKEWRDKGGRQIYKILEPVE